jgi:hypothetical protein
MTENPVALLRNAEGTGLERAELDPLAVWIDEAKDDVSRGESRVTTEIDLDRRREPAERVGVAFRHEECRLRQIVLGRDRLQRRIRQPLLEWHDGGRIAAEEAIGEGVDLIDRQAHGSLLVRSSARDVARRLRACRRCHARG